MIVVGQRRLRKQLLCGNFPGWAANGSKQHCYVCASFLCTLQLVFFAVGIYSHKAGMHLERLLEEFVRHRQRRCRYVIFGPLCDIVHHSKCALGLLGRRARLDLLWGGLENSRGRIGEGGSQFGGATRLGRTHFDCWLRACAAVSQLPAQKCAVAGRRHFPSPQARGPLGAQAWGGEADPLQLGWWVSGLFHLRANATAAVLRLERYFYNPQYWSSSSTVLLWYYCSGYSTTTLLQNNCSTTTCSTTTLLLQNSYSTPTVLLQYYHSTTAVLSVQLCLTSALPSCRAPRPDVDSVRDHAGLVRDLATLQPDLRFSYPGMVRVFKMLNSQESAPQFCTR